MNTVQTITGTREGLHRQADQLHLLPFWTLRSEVELVEPRSAALPYIWRWAEIAPLLRASAELVTIEEAERRALLFANPTLGGKAYMTSTLYGALQLIRPGESAPCHRHTPSASRFILEGSGGFTTVEGEKCRMSPGDLIMTPNWTWHDHGNDGAEDVIWFDMLDVPLVEKLDGTFFDFDYREASPASGEPVKRSHQSIKKPLDYSDALYSTGGVSPKFVSDSQGEASPLFVYKWENARDALHRLASHPGSPYDGIVVEYTNPLTGGPAMPTMSFRMQLLRPGERTLVHRHTSSSVYCVVRGAGHTLVGGTRLEWTKNDVFAIPGWVWHEHSNLQRDEEAILYSVSDMPTMKKLGLYREQGRTPAGDTVTIEVR